MKNRYKYVSDSIVRRIPDYLRALRRLDCQVNCGEQNISSVKLGQLTGYGASRVRNDLSVLGCTGKTGIGYSALELKKALKKIVGADNNLKTVVVGETNLCFAIVQEYNNNECGVDFHALFAPETLDLTMYKDWLPVYQINYLPAYLKNNIVDIVIVCTSRKSAKRVYTYMAKSDIRGILNLSDDELPCRLSAVEERCCLSDSLLHMGYRLADRIKST